MKKIIVLLLLFLTAVNFFAENSLSLNTFFNDAELKKVLDGEIVSRMCIKGNASGENTDLEIDIPRTKYADEDFSSYEVVIDEKAFIPYDMENTSSKIKFYNILTAYSKLKGMQYYSRMRKQTETFILKSKRIDPDKNTTIDDVTYNEIKPKIENYFFQTDNKFGKLKFRSDLYNDGNNFVMVNTCIQPVSKLFFVINKKDETKFISYFIYSKEQKGFFYYSFNVMKVRLKFLLSENDVMTLNPTLFSSRLRASTVHFAKLLGLNWEDKLNPWDEDLLEKGVYKNY
jgi:hypothetical protein